MPYVLFYSSLCKHSKKFVQILDRSQVSKFFIKILVDVNPQTNRRPDLVYNYGIKEVPTIIIDENILPGVEAFNWLKKAIEYENPASISSRQNKPRESLKEYSSSQENGNKVKEFEVRKFGDSCFELQQTGDGGFNIPSNSITQQNLQELNVKKEGNRLPSINVKKDSLKTKQCNNAYNKLLEERNLI